jgi:hypothetical protein
VKRFVALLVGGFGLGAWFTRSRQKQSPVAEASPADELRARLAETKATAAPEAEAEADPETRRRELHDRTRAQIDELR